MLGRIRATTLVALCGCCSAPSWAAGYFELSGNGSYFKYNNGVQNGQPSTTTVTRLGAGLAYRFMANTALEFNYLYSRTNDTFGQDIVSESEVFYINRVTELQNYSMNLVLHFTDRKSSFRPYVFGGAGYMVRKTSASGHATDKISSADRSLSFAASDPIKSLSADAGMGLSMFVLDQIAFELSGTVYATDLDKSEIFLHYTFAGGFRFLF